MSIKNHCKALAAHADGIFRWTFHIICGHCERSFSVKERDIMTITNMNRELAGCCPYCGFWNRTGLFRED